MKALITGNMGTGKSHLAKAVLKLAPPFTSCHAVDDYRRKYGDGSMKQEGIARAAFLTAIQAPGNMLIECMGLGDLGLEVRETLTDDSYAVVLLKAPLEICLDRLSHRLWEVPYPGTRQQAIEMCISSQAEYEAGKIEARFSTQAAGGLFSFLHITQEHTDYISSFILSKLEHETA
jgi:hypothetical protein